jgi:hypothetical protein
LKFEDIETKMIEKAGGGQDDPSHSKMAKKSQEIGEQLRKSILENLEISNLTDQARKNGLEKGSRDIEGENETPRKIK